MGERYRRSPALVFYWQDNRLACFDPQSGRRATASVEVLSLLHDMPDWVSARALASRQPEVVSPRALASLLDHLARHGLVQRFSTAREWNWQQWTPEAAFFHFGTRNRHYSRRPLEYERVLRQKARVSPPPPATTSRAGVRTALPASTVGGSLASVLQERRTWRTFSPRPMKLADLGALLQLTFGVQSRRRVPGQGPIVFKTSPSGGARHAIEAYVLARGVKGLAAGAYHYDAATHELVGLRQRATDPSLQRALAHQRWFVKASAVVVMSAVFERTMWRYPSNRAYRAVLTEAGHLGQTFCLVATALNLAPFCTMAFRDRELEEMIGVDGVNEAAMYVVGVGTRPNGAVANPGKILTAY
jgi:SagB-type dehydrogenase family enzyme